MNTAWLLLISYMFIFYSRYWGIIATVLTVLAFQGLREIANVLAEPLGNDETDIPVRTNASVSLSLPINKLCAGDSMVRRPPNRNSRSMDVVFFNLLKTACLFLRPEKCAVLFFADRCRLAA